MNEKQRKTINGLQDKGASEVELEPMGADGTMRMSYHMEGQNLSATLTPEGEILPASKPANRERHSQ